MFRRLALLALLASLVVAGAPSQAQTLSVAVGNTAPTVASVTLPGATLTPTSAGSTSVATTIVVSDLNGCSDVSSVTLEILKPDGSSHAAPAAATYSSCAAGTSATYTRTFTMAYHDAPALSTSTYKVKIVVTDSKGATGNNLASLAAFNYAELAALSLGASTLDFAELDPGEASSIVALPVQNAGNVQIDVQLSGTSLAHASESASIPVGSLAYSSAANMTGSAAATTSAATLSSFDLGRGASSSKSVYWRLNVPDASTQWVPSGAYTGTLTVTATGG